MDNFLIFLDQNRGGIFVLAGIVVFLILIIQWLAWIFHIGRYKQQTAAGSARERTAQFVFGEFLAKVISDFRNLLAVMIVLVFALILAFGIFRSNTLEEMGVALQAVMSTLGGLVGSIVGYYFGESAVKSGASGTGITTSQPAVQKPASGVGGDDEEIQPAPPPRPAAPANSPSEPKG
jgi:membrane protein YqaA with SNARE-associated domain